MTKPEPYRMTESLLLQFIDNVYSAKVDYCFICLRTGVERRLEQPHYLKKFVQAIHEPFMPKNYNQLVCYVCERQAAAAFRFRIAVNVAAHTHSVLMQLIKAPLARKQILNKFNSGDLEGMEQESGNGTAAMALRCEARMRRLRARSQLLYTEVLVVSTPSTVAPEASTLETTDTSEVNGDFLTTQNYTELSSGPGQPYDQYVVPDASCAGAGELVSDCDLKNEPVMEMESIIIYEDDDSFSIIKNKHTESPGKANDTILTNVANNTPTNLKATRADPTRTAPIAPALFPKHQLLNQPAPELSDRQVIVGSDFILHPIVFNSGMLTVPSLASNIVNGKLISCDNSIETPQLALQNGENINFIAEPSKVTSILKMLSHQDATKTRIFTPAPESAPKSGTIDGFGDSDFNVDKGPSVKCNDVAKETLVSAKAAQLRSDRIDWEDKIPMDVISFMDANESSSKRARRATDPPPPLGISNVTSLYQNNNDEVIDLC